MCHDITLFPTSVKLQLKVKSPKALLQLASKTYQAYFIHTTVQFENIPPPPPYWPAGWSPCCLQCKPFPFPLAQSVPSSDSTHMVYCMDRGREGRGEGKPGEWERRGKKKRKDEKWERVSEKERREWDGKGAKEVHEKDERKWTHKAWWYNIYYMYHDTVPSPALHSHQIVLAMSAYHRRSALVPGYIRRVQSEMKD